LWTIPNGSSPSADFEGLEDGRHEGCIRVDAEGNIYMIASRDSSIVTMKISPDGFLEWEAHCSYGDTTLPVGLWLDSLGNVYVVAQHVVYNPHQITYSIVKYVQTPDFVQSNPFEVPLFYALSQNYPNPFNPTTTISYQLPVNSNVTLKIFDMLGREIATLVNERQQAGQKVVQWDASTFSSGIYFCRLTAGNCIETKKMLLLR
jgi:hypothetical protein